MIILLVLSLAGLSCVSCYVNSFFYRSLIFECLSIFRKGTAHGRWLILIVTHSSWEPSSNQSPWQVFHIFYNIMTRKSFTVYNHQICVPKSWPFLWHNELVCPWWSFNLNWLSWLASLVHLWSLDRTELINKSPGCINPCFSFLLSFT